MSVSRSGSSLTGSSFTITFISPTRDYPDVAVDVSGLSGPTPGFQVSTFVNGSEALVMDPIPAEYLQVPVTLTLTRTDPNAQLHGLGCCLVVCLRPGLH